MLLTRIQDMKFLDLEGNLVSISDYRGKIL